MSDSVAVEDVIDVVAEHFGCSKIDIRSQRRTRKVVAPRQIAMYLARRITERSLPQIGAALGGRDHTTVLHALDRVEAMLSRNPILADEVAELEIAAVALAKMRGRGLLPPPGKLVSPAQLARQIAAGGHRAAIRATPDQVLELCDALLAAEEAKEAKAVLAARGIEPPPLLVEEPPLRMVDIVHDFCGVEARLRQSPSNREMAFARAEMIERFRRLYDDNVEARRLVAAYDHMVKAEYTAGERDANERYRKAVSALADILKTKEAANA